MRFAIPLPQPRSFKVGRKPSDWPLALRFAVLVIPAGVLISLAAVWLGYSAASGTLRESLGAQPLLAAKVQARRMEETLADLRYSLLRIAQSHALNAQVLRNDLALFFQNNTDLILEVGYKSRDNGGFLLLRDENGFKELSMAEASLGPYSPFQQINALSLKPGHAALSPVVYFDDPASGQEQHRHREPVMRMSLQLNDNTGTLVLGINVARWQARLSSYLGPGSPMYDETKSDSLRLAFFFDTRGWVLFEMDGSPNKGYVPDVARQGYTGDLGRAGYDAAFRPWAKHENYWRMVTDANDGRYGTMPLPADKYAPVHVGATGLLSFAPVYFRTSEGAEPQIIGGMAFFETSPLPLAAFLKVANHTLIGAFGALVMFCLLAWRVNRKLAAPFRNMAAELNRMSESGELAFVGSEPACEEQQKFQASINSIISGALSAQNDLQRLSREMHHTRSSLPVDLMQPLAKALPEAEFGLVGTSPLIREVRDLVRKAAKAGTDVLIWGETGTGKELIAAAIHKAGSRSEGPYISINCGALDENLLLDALFGHVKGAFTEAKNDRKGAFLAANGGTLHLDEIANASLKVQQSLLRALSVRRIRPLGTDQEIPFNTRVVAATNVDLRECVRAGTFREDLYYRLAIISIESPPLRHRKEDIPELAAFCIHEAAQTLGRGEARLSRGALEVMTAYDWPGNVREFKNCLTRAMAFVEGDIILRQHISLEQDAFRTYAKPLAPRVLAEMLHQPETKNPRNDAISPRDAKGLQSAAPLSGNVAGDLWPPPPRDSFTPARFDGTDLNPTSFAEADPTSTRFAEVESAAQANNAARPYGPVSRPYVTSGDATLPAESAVSFNRDASSSRMREDRYAAPPQNPNGNLDTMNNWAAFGSHSITGPLAGTSEFVLRLNERQSMALSHIKEQGQITRAEYEAVAGQGVSSRTAQNDLRELVELGILSRQGAGPGTRYVLAKKRQGASSS